MILYFLTMHLRQGVLEIINPRLRPPFLQGVRKLFAYIVTLHSNHRPCFLFAKVGRSCMEEDTRAYRFVMHPSAVLS